MTEKYDFIRLAAYETQKRRLGFKFYY